MVWVRSADLPALCLNVCVHHGATLNSLGVDLYMLAKDSQRCCSEMLAVQKASLVLQYFGRTQGMYIYIYLFIYLFIYT